MDQNLENCDWGKTFANIRTSAGAAKIDHIGAVRMHLKKTQWRQIKQMQPM